MWTASSAMKVFIFSIWLNLKYYTTLYFYVEVCSGVLLSNLVLQKRNQFDLSGVLPNAWLVVQAKIVLAC
jgi:hypothetical protein